jgi:cell division protein FtsZ
MEPEPAPYMPPPETPRPRMPSVEDFPRAIQEQIRQARGETAPVEERRKSIFERLASFGASRQEDAAQTVSAPARPLAPPPPPSAADYARRQAAPAGTDGHGRRAPQHRMAEEDHLEIPAFLRRQSNNG